MKITFETFESCEEQIVDQLGDDLFYGHLTKGNLKEFSDLVPVTAFDLIVSRALERALEITIPSGISGTINRKGNKK